MKSSFVAYLVDADKYKEIIRKERLTLLDIFIILAVEARTNACTVPMSLDIVKHEEGKRSRRHGISIPS